MMPSLYPVYTTNFIHATMKKQGSHPWTAAYTGQAYWNRHSVVRMWTKTPYIGFFTSQVLEPVFRHMQSSRKRAPFLGAYSSRYFQTYQKLYQKWTTDLSLTPAEVPKSSSDKDQVTTRIEPDDCRITIQGNPRALSHLNESAYKNKTVRFYYSLQTVEEDGNTLQMRNSRHNLFTIQISLHYRNHLVVHYLLSIAIDMNYTHSSVWDQRVIKTLWTSGLEKLWMWI